MNDHERERDDEYERAHAWAVREQQERQEITDAVEALSRIANRSLSPAIFVEAMSREHRTLQQSMTGLMLAWFKHLANETHYDLRNEASVRMARKVMEVVDGTTRLPFI